MKRSCIPDPIKYRLIETLTKKAFYGQVATVNAEGHPRVRSVHCRYAEEFATIGFSTHQKSPKWRELEKTPFLAGCFYDVESHFQWRWEGPVNLVTSGALVERFWKLIRPSIRETYWRESEVKRAVGGEEERCPEVGAVVCLPVRWELLDLNDDDYRKTTRHEYKLEGAVWVCRELTSVNSFVK